MDFAGPASTIETVEDDDSILFRVIPHRRWIDLFPAVLIIMGAIALTTQLGFGIAALAGMGLAGWWAFQWLSSPKMHSLFVTEYDLVSSTAGTVRWCQIFDLTYIRGGEDQPTGLFATGPLSDVCLLELDEEQTLAVMTAIYVKFPYPVVMPRSENPLSQFLDRIPILGGNSSVLTTLNLSHPKDPKA